MDVKRIAEEASVIINGYAVRDCPEGFRVDNLNNGGGSCVFKSDETLVETNMDDVELSIARDCVHSARKYMVEA